MHLPGDRPPRLTAVLGPTNTGKTHLAVERMLGHSSGMIGLPLRLLAREVYDRVADRVGARAVALITGEEKLVPPNPRYYVCTVEAMPLDVSVAFLAVDEIQVAADPERGHVFTQRLLHARGRQETMFLGAATMKRLVHRLVPGVEFVTRPRFSTLAYTGPKKIARLPPRSAVVTFTAADVYAVAEYLRRQRGGAAVVLGALSPRTRNAQVALYQAGEVDYMVATDAIGMGLNMDVNHVAFAAVRKYDGRSERALNASEVAQIAGRAGRHMNDGTFGTSTEVGPLDAAIVDAVENHRFPALRAVNWRNAELDTTSLATLQRSLEEPPPAAGLLRAPDVDDYLALRTLARDAAIASLATTPDAVRLLWDVCQIPDYRKIMADAHIRLLDRIYRHLMHGDGLLPDDWVARLVTRLDRGDGDIDTLATRIAHVRTWTYVSHRIGWLADPAHWQERTRAIEDRLSDALHERLTQRFIDRRASMLVRRMTHDGDLVAIVDGDGAVAVEGHFIGRLDGFCFVADAASAPNDGKALWRAAKQTLRGEIARRVADLAADDDGAFGIDDRARVSWRGAIVARLVAGAEPLAPRLELVPSELLAGPAYEKVERRLVAWLDRYLDAAMGPLLALRAADIEGPARGVAFQLGEALGMVPRHTLMQQLNGLDAKDRKMLGRLGVRLGQESVYLQSLLKPRSLEARALLWAVHRNQPRVPPVPAGGRVSAAVNGAITPAFYAAIGYRIFDGRALRVDIVERVAARARKLSRLGSFAAGAELLAMSGCGAEEMGKVLVGLGYRPEAPDAAGVVCYAAPERKPGRKPRRPAGRRRPRDPDSPFAKLAELRPGK